MIFRFFLLVVIYCLFLSLPKIAFAAPSTLQDFWEGKSEWKMIQKFTYNNPQAWSGFDYSVQIEVVNEIWYMFSRKLYPSTTDCGGMSKIRLGTVVSKSSDKGINWTTPVEILTPDTGTAWECAAMDGDAYYNGQTDTWHYLFQCLAQSGGWNGCHVEKQGIDPMGRFSETHPNPVIRGGDLWNRICDTSLDNCVQIAGGIGKVYDEGTFDIFDFTDGWYYIDFHGFDGIHGYRGIGKTRDFRSYIAGDKTLGVPSDAIVDRNDALSWKESWKDDSPIGFGAGRIIKENGYYYLFSEAADTNLVCTPGQRWDWGLFRSNNLTSTNWEQYPAGNPIFYSSLYPEINNQPPSCTPHYGGVFQDTDESLYLHISRYSLDGTFGGIYFYKLTPKNNMLQNGAFWSCALGNEWRTISPGNNQTQMTAFRYPNFSSDGNCYMELMCNGTNCDSGQSVYQDVSVSNINNPNLIFGGKFAAEGQNGKIVVSLFELDNRQQILYQYHSPFTTEDNIYREISMPILLHANTQIVRFQVYPLTTNKFRLDELFVNERKFSLSEIQKTLKNYLGSEDNLSRPTDGMVNMLDIGFMMMWSE